MIVMFAAIAGLNAYVLYRVWNMLPPVVWLRWAALAVGVLAFVSFFASVLMGDGFPLGLTTVMYKLGTSWFFIALYMAMMFLVLDLFRVTHLLPVGKFMYGSWSGAIGMAVVTIVIFVAGNINYHNKRRVEITIDTHGKLARPMKIVAMSDLHLGYGIGNGELARWVGKVNAEKPDIILIPGDVIDNSLTPLVETGTAGVLRRFNAKYGVWASPGNHEYISGVGESLDFLHSAGVNVLRDSVALVDSSLYVVGRDDMTNRGRKRLGDLTAGLDVDKPVIVLDHQPVELGQLIGSGVTLQLSGHTHRGQVWPISWITDAIFERSHGLLEKDGTYVYVSSGMGIWGGKFRIGTRSEYVVINLK